MACVYGIRAKDSDVYFYVGCTCKTPNIRLSQHLADVRHNRHCNPHFSNKVKKIGIENIAIDTLEECAKESQFARELHWINHLQDSGVQLTNIVYDGVPYSKIHAIAGKYSLKRNWEWAQQWYEDYKRGAVVFPDNERQVEMLTQTARVLAEIIAHVQSVPENERQTLIDYYDTPPEKR